MTTESERVKEYLAKSLAAKGCKVTESWQHGQVGTRAYVEGRLELGVFADSFLEYRSAAEAEQQQLEDDAYALYVADAKNRHGIYADSWDQVKRVSRHDEEQFLMLARAARDIWKGRLLK